MSLLKYDLLNALFLLMVLNVMRGQFVVVSRYDTNYNTRYNTRYNTSFNTEYEADTYKVTHVPRLESLGPPMHES